MPAPTYLTFDLLIESSPPSYRARVINSPVGEASATFTLPFSDQERAALVGRIADGDADALKEMGQKLFDAAFSGEVFTSFRRSSDAAGHNGAGLRVRLRLGDVPALATLPWESLYDTSANRFLAQSDETPLVRYLDLPSPGSLAVTPPLNILVLPSSPADYPPLQIEDEWKRLTAALAPLQQQGLVSLDRADVATPDELQDRLRQKDFHIFHFIGHGAFSAQNGDGVLILTDDDNSGRQVDGATLGVALKSRGSLRLALLNACEGAHTAAGNPFAGVAGRLVQQGIPAVIAMQFEVSDDAATTFAQEFYRALADLYPVDAAMAEARRIVALKGNAVEWATPVLFMRSPDGQIFQKENKAMDAEQPAKPQHGGVNISGGSVSVGGDMVGGDKIVSGGDTIIANVGAGAKNVAVGKQITQSVNEGAAADQQSITQQFAALNAALDKMRGQLDATTAQMAPMQVELLQGELSKTGDDKPSANAIVKVGDWLVKSVKPLTPALKALFTSPAVIQVLQKAGDAAVIWARNQFGG